MSLSRRMAAEFIGTAFLLIAVVGSGIMGERLSNGNAALALLANSLATGAALVVLITTFGPISGAHFNPLVTLIAALDTFVAWRDVPVYLAAQMTGAFAGVACANLMFGFPAFFASTHVRSGAGQMLSEVLATAGLISLIWIGARFRVSVAYSVGMYIMAAYWFSSSTSFANPAVTLARAATDTFAGIRLVDAPAFIAAQVGGSVIGFGFVRWILPSQPPESPPLRGSEPPAGGEGVQKKHTG